mmetsp:Transcript_29286/g.82623  ORF Transcript_29286/g.82623 Transcript_29286/m.82623 type:complete len:279 (+) Transcript_29286:198-1034(+)|eukprot:CAMPEP_0117675932 /NCGR_PEP_ID=MMETSP0804-20121206/15879_1 /TAXON_ID=1074897 /ORGANISM="Tetraselmis astigmatica, Strain CCMP880" /LENGTH=278 /DNA_ID=CAMNT_0005484989 /DNA_START=174 /DNA_END=1010 /DNA_ORIENTATION=-
MASAEKPSYPEGYSIPEVWESDPQGATMGGMNRPTAGARSEKELPKGEHSLQLYSLGTPNGQKVTILLEELNELKGVEYDAWKINIMDLDQFTSGFVAVNPNSKIPALLDYELTPPLRVFETGSILLHLAERFDAFIPQDKRKRTECLNWLFWQHGGAPFMGGGFGHFYNYAPLKIQYAIDRYAMETKRQLDVLDKQLEGRDFIVDEYSIADMAVYPWIVCLSVHYKAGKFLQLDGYENVQRWMATLKARPAVARGMRVNSFGEGAVSERHSAADFDQ